MDQSKENAEFPSCDAYFEAIQSKKKLPLSLQESLTAAFAQIPVSSFPEVPTGRVIEIPGDTSVLEAVRILSEHNIRAAPVLNPEPGALADWKGRYLGVIDYSAVILWVLENAELASVALSAGSATAAGVGMGAVGAVGVTALGATGPAAVAGLTAAAVGAAVAGGLTAEMGVAKDGLASADHLGEDFYKVLLEQEPFKSTTVRSIVESYHWSPFVPITLDSSMLTVLLLLSKYRLRNVPVIEPDKPVIKNFITQTGVVKGLQQCKGRDWFDYISALPLSDLGLPFMSIDEVITVKSDDLILEAFKCMKDNKIGGVPVVEGPKRKLVGSVSIRDIRFLLLRPDLFSNFRQLTVIEFMKTLGSTLPDSGNNCLVQPPPTCAPDTSLGSVIDSIASRITHRIYVVDGDLEVVGVVTLRDVISCFIHEPPGYWDTYLASAILEKHQGKGARSVEKARALCNVNVGITGRVHVVSLVGIMLSDCVNRVNSA
ncbi:LOW QUALITY PROTEIN: SNF1-related protein kinase regulatory subunit gamma-1-like [Panicum hallii]|uniref:LOW QUALITY PROTEIN: SNF1-related protein kinase regulatory subunit gamma-1-like n=1 Tax=Panicum hallii TaxID=206008 RepID=UPI000DF4E226|nr:LOW QUALITY PROTEIN: SNF1-related protein kinase regulatory subunit gamma-1-like [Panicum hallii]